MASSNEKVRNTKRATYIVYPDKKLVIVIQRWKYHWISTTGQSTWTSEEKSQFHSDVNEAIDFAWSSRVTLEMATNAQIKGPNSWTLEFGIKWVSGEEHWRVNVRKVSPGTIMRSSVVWKKQTIYLDTEDVVFRIRNKKVPSSTERKQHMQLPVAHELGHTIGNTSHKHKGDEYKQPSAHKSDHNSMMNIGGEIRKRHVGEILEELNKIYSNVTWKVKAISQPGF